MLIDWMDKQCEYAGCTLPASGQEWGNGEPVRYYCASHGGSEFMRTQHLATGKSDLALSVG
jgi:hypothetical protein